VTPQYTFSSSTAGPPEMSCADVATTRVGPPAMGTALMVLLLVQ
jgi:hypothetical protein